MHAAGRLLAVHLLSANAVGQADAACLLQKPRKDGNTAIHEAAQCGDEKLLIALMRLGADRFGRNQVCRCVLLLQLAAQLCSCSLPAQHACSACKHDKPLAARLVCSERSVRLRLISRVFTGCTHFTHIFSAAAAAAALLFVAAAHTLPVRRTARRRAR